MNISFYHSLIEFCPPLIFYLSRWCGNYLLERTFCESINSMYLLCYDAMISNSDTWVMGTFKKRTVKYQNFAKKIINTFNQDKKENNNCFKLALFLKKYNRAPKIQITAEPHVSLDMVFNWIRNIFTTIYYFIYNNDFSFIQATIG